MIDDRVEEELKDKLYNAFYWYYRIQYATAIDYFKNENNLYTNKTTTKSSEKYIYNKIKELINKLEGAIYDE